MVRLQRDRAPAEEAARITGRARRGLRVLGIEAANSFLEFPLRPGWFGNDSRAGLLFLSCW